MRILVFGFDADQAIVSWLTRGDVNITVGPFQSGRVDNDGELLIEIDPMDFSGTRLTAGDYLLVTQDAENKYRPSLAPFRILP